MGSNPADDHTWMWESPRKRRGDELGYDVAHDRAAAGEEAGHRWCLCFGELILNWQDISAGDLVRRN